MRTLKRKICDAVPCRPTPFLRPPAQRWAAGAPFFLGLMLQRQERPKEEERKDPLTEGLKITGENLAKHKPFKHWYEPKLEGLKYTLWDKASSADKAAILAYLGLNLGTAAAAFSLDPNIRAALSGVNVGKPLGWIPYSPIEGFRYTLPEPGRSAYGLSADFTLSPYLDMLRKKHPHLPLTGATFGLESAYDPAGKEFSLTGGKASLEFFGGALNAEARTFKDLSPYPLSDLPTAVMQQVPGLPPIGGTGYQFRINADLLKLFPALTTWF
jgi:hypothetical protein